VAGLGRYFPNFPCSPAPLSDAPVAVLLCGWAEGLASWPQKADCGTHDRQVPVRVCSRVAPQALRGPALAWGFARVDRAGHVLGQAARAAGVWRLQGERQQSALKRTVGLIPHDANEVAQPPNLRNPAQEKPYKAVEAAPLAPTADGLSCRNHASAGYGDCYEIRARLIRWRSVGEAPAVTSHLPISMTRRLRLTRSLPRMLDFAGVELPSIEGGCTLDCGRPVMWPSGLQASAS
jgi:hypothetical protein